jgi:hypothetical protein
MFCLLNEIGVVYLMGYVLIWNVLNKEKRKRDDG